MKYTIRVNTLVGALVFAVGCIGGKMAGTQLFVQKRMPEGLANKTNPAMESNHENLLANMENSVDGVQETIVAPDSEYKDVESVAVVGMIGGIIDGSQRNAAWASYLGTLAITNYHNAMVSLDDWMRSQMDQENNLAFSTYYTAIETIATSMAERDPAGAMDALTDILFRPDSEDLPKTDQLEEYINAVFRKWASTDPTAAFQYLGNIKEKFSEGNESLGHMLTKNLAKEWAIRDPNAALTWISGLSDQEHDMVIGSVVVAIAQSNPYYSSTLLNRITDALDQAVIAGEIGAAWAQRDPEKALEWAASLDGNASYSATSRAFQAWFENDAQAAQSAFENMSGPARDAILMVYVQQFWMEDKDFSMAAQFLGQEPDGPGRGAAIIDVMGNWVRVDPYASLGWLREQLPNSLHLDGAVKDLGYTLVDIDPLAAVLWVNVIQDPDMRQEELGRTVEAWFEQEPAQALKWIHNSQQLSDEDRTALALNYPAFFEVSQ